MARIDCTIRTAPSESDQTISECIAQSGGQSVWLYHEDEDSVELQDSDSKTLAMFNDSEDVMTDPTAYPAAEADIENFDEWSVVKQPVIPTVMFGEGGLDREMVDMIAIGDESLVVLEDGGETRTPIGELVEGNDSDGKLRTMSRARARRTSPMARSRWQSSKR